MAVSKWNWNTANPSTVHIATVAQSMEEGREDYKDYHWVPDGEYSQRQVFPPLYFHATQAQVQTAYAALTGHTKTTNFNQRVWNDLVDKIVELQQDFGISPTEWLNRERSNEIQNPISAYISSEEPGYVSKDGYGGVEKHKNLGHALYAYKFNLLVDALVTLPATWEWPWEEEGVEIAPGTPVKGSYILALVRAINYWCDQPQAQFTATFALTNLLGLSANMRIADTYRINDTSIPMPFVISGAFEQINPSDIEVDEDWLKVFDMTTGEFRLPDACDIEMYQYIVEDADVEIWMGEFDYAPPGPINAATITGHFDWSYTFHQAAATHITTGISEATSVSVSGIETISSASIPKSSITGSLSMDNVGLECIDAGSVFTEPIVFDFHSSIENNVVALQGNVLDTIDLRFELSYNKIEMSSANRVELWKTFTDFSIECEPELEVLTRYVELSVSTSFSIVPTPTLVDLPEAPMTARPYLTTEFEVLFTPLMSEELSGTGVIRSDFQALAKSNYAVHPEIDTSIITENIADMGDHQYLDLIVHATLTFENILDIQFRQAAAMEAIGAIDVFTNANSNGDDKSAPTEAETIILTDYLASGRICRGMPAEAETGYIISVLANCASNRFIPMEALATIREAVTAELEEMNLETIQALATLFVEGTGELEYTIGQMFNVSTFMTFVTEVEVPVRRRAFYLSPPADTVGTFYTSDGDIFLDADGNDIVTSANIFEVTTFNMEFKGDMFITSDGMQLFTSDDKEFTPL